MTTDAMEEYVRGELKRGTSREAIRANLLQNGWSPADVAEVFAILTPNLPIPGAPAAPQSAPAPGVLVPPLPPTAGGAPPAAAPLRQGRVPARAGRTRALVLIAIAIIILIALVAGGAYAYADMAAPRLVASGIEATGALAAYHADITITGTEQGSANDIHATIGANIDRRDPKDPRIDAEIAGDIGASGFTVSLSAELRYVAEMLYIRINTFPGMPAGITGRWLNAPASALAAGATSTAASQAGGRAFVGDLLSSGALAFSSPAPTVDANGPALAYTVTVDKEKLAEALAQLEASSGAPPQSPLPSAAEIADQLKGTDFMPISLRMSLPSRIIDHVAGGVTFTPTAAAQALSGGIAGRQPATILWTFDLGSFGTAVAAEAPASSTPLSSALGGITLPFSGGAHKTLPTMRSAPLMGRP